MTPSVERRNFLGFPGGARGRYGRSHKRREFDPWVEKILWRRAWQPTPVFLPGESLGQRDLASYSPLCHKELDATEVHTHLTCTHTGAC